MNRTPTRTLLCGTMLLSALSSVHAQGPTIPFFRSFSGFGLDSNPGGIPGYGIASEDFDFSDAAIPRNTAVNIVNKNYGGAIVTSNTRSDDFGFFAAKNFAKLSVSNVQNAGYYAVAGRGSHTTVEFFTPEALAQRAVFRWHVSGVSNTNVGTATSRIDFAAGVYPTTDFNGFFDIPEGPRLQRNGPGDYTYNLPLLLNQPIDLFYWSSAFVEVKDSEIAPVVGKTISAQADFSNTFVLDDIQLFDSSDNPITNWTMHDTNTGLTVFDQNGRTPAAGNAIPEPTTALFLVLGGTLALARRRR